MQNADTQLATIEEDANTQIAHIEGNVGTQTARTALVSQIE